MMMSGTGLTARARSHVCARKDWQNKGEVGSQRGTGRAQRPDSKTRYARPDLYTALCDLLKRFSTPRAGDPTVAEAMPERLAHEIGPCDEAA